MDHLVVAGHLDSRRTQIVDRAVVLSLRSPLWAEALGPEAGERLALDYDLNLAALSKAIRYRSPLILCDHVRSRCAQLIKQGYSSRHLREALSYKWSAISVLLPQEALPTIAAYLEMAIHMIEPAARAVRG